MALRSNTPSGSNGSRAALRAPTHPRLSFRVGTIGSPKLDAGGVEAVWEGTVGFWLSNATRTAHPDREAALRESFLRTAPEGYRGCAHALMQLDYMRHLHRITVPALFVSGEHDGGATPATMEAMAAACPGAEYVSVSGAKHVINVDQPQAFMLAISRFFHLDAE